MRRFIIILIYFLSFSCTIKQKNTVDFKMEQIFYNKDNVITDNFNYDSKSEVLVAHFKPIKVRLSSGEKNEILSYYKELNFNNDCVWVMHKDNTSTKSRFYYIPLKDASNCSSNKDEVEKHFLLNIKIQRILKESTEYKKNFTVPDEY